MIPPRHFRPVEGELASARMSQLPPPFLRDRKRTGAKARGVRYELKAQEYLLDQFSDHYIPSPWLHFREEASESFRWCQPDGILLDFERGVCIVLEIKYSHTSDAWWQLRKLYIPVLQKILPPSLWTYELGEIVKWFDPDVAFPEPIRLVDNPMKPSDVFKIHIFNP